MKKVILNTLILYLAVLTFSGCAKEEPPIVLSFVEGGLEYGVLNGSLNEDYTLDSRVIYSLNSSFIVNSGATLTIPEGTKIKAASGGSGVYIAVLRGGKINVQGTAENPVLMSTESGKNGGWGGLVICGEATTTAGTNAQAEIGGFEYGGTNNEDNSGSINYLIIKGSGAQINAESQYNGLSLYAVGSKTAISNVAVIDGSDDGIEFFGGTVSASNLYMKNLEDDSIDWTEGWNGTLTNTYIYHDVTGFSTALEGDKVNNNPKFINLTAISTVGGIGLQFKKNSGATITGLFLSGYDESIDMKDDGPIENVMIEGEIASKEKEYKANRKWELSWDWIDIGF